MKALFLAHSPLLQPNTSLASIDNIHVYELICRMLNIRPNANNGTLSAWSAVMKGGSTNSSAVEFSRPVPQ